MFSNKKNQLNKFGLLKNYWFYIEKQPCWVDQTIKSVDPTRTPDSYMPRCKADGTYFRIQCHKKEGFCWCVTPAGKVVPNTIVQGQKPKCDNGRGLFEIIFQ